MYCTHCGKEMPNGATFCPACGKAQTAPKKVTPNFQQQPAQTTARNTPIASGKPKRKKTGKMLPVLIAVACIAITVIFFAVINSGDGYDKLSDYAWGAAAEPILRDIGVQEIKEIRAESDAGIDFYITTEKTILDLTVTQDHTGAYEVLFIGVNPNCEDFGKHYYYKDSLLKDDQGRYLETVYDYTTGEIICEADEAAVEEHKQETAGILQSVQEYAAQRREDDKQEARERLQTMVSDYQNNEVAAESKYKDNVYTLCGTIEDIGLDVLDNPYIVVEADLHVVCYFDKSEAEKIAEMNLGDTIIFQGTCDGAGVVLDVTFTDCTVLTEYDL